MDVLKGYLVQRDELNQKTQAKIAAERQECSERYVVRFDSS